MSQKKRIKKARRELPAIKVLCVFGKTIDVELTAKAYQKLEHNFPSGRLIVTEVNFEDGDGLRDAIRAKPDVIVVVCREQDLQGLARVYQIISELTSSRKPLVYLNGVKREPGPPPIMSTQHLPPTTPDAQGVQIDLTIKRTRRDRFN